MRQLKIFICFIFTSFAVIVTLTACSSFYKEDKAVLHQSNTTNTRPLAIPEGLNNGKMEDYYPMPQLKTQPAAIPVSIVPPGSVLDKQARATATKK